MRRLLSVLLLSTIVVGCSRREQPKTETSPPQAGAAANRNEPGPLQGTWRVTSIGNKGRTMPPEKFAGLRVIIAGDVYTAQKDGNAFERATIKVDPASKPKAIDLTFTEGEYKGQKVLGIYELTGDTLRMALPEPGRERPTEIANRVGSTVDVWEYRRETP